MLLLAGIIFFGVNVIMTSAPFLLSQHVVPILSQICLPSLFYIYTMQTYRLQDVKFFELQDTRASLFHLVDFFRIFEIIRFPNWAVRTWPQYGTTTMHLARVVPLPTGTFAHTFRFVRTFIYICMYSYIDTYPRDVIRKSIVYGCSIHEGWKGRWRRGGGL